MPKRIRVAVVDNYPVVRTGVAVVLNAFDDFELVGEAANGLEAVALCDRVHPDVVLMDLAIPGLDGIAATRAIRQTDPTIQVIILSGLGREELVTSALHAGAAQFLLKNVSGHELAEAIRAVYTGQVGGDIDKTK